MTQIVPVCRRRVFGGDAFPARADDEQRRQRMAIGCGEGIAALHEVEIFSGFQRADEEEEGVRNLEPRDVRRAGLKLDAKVYYFQLLCRQVEQLHGFVGGELAVANDPIGAAQTLETADTRASLPAAKAAGLPKHCEIMQCNDFPDVGRAGYGQGRCGAVENVGVAAPDQARSYPGGPEEFAKHGFHSALGLRVVEVFHRPDEFCDLKVGAGEGLKAR